MPSAAENKHIKRLRILEAANHLFLNGSVTDTAIDDVVKLAGVAKGTFYLYFRDKYDLLDQIVVQRAAEIFSAECRTLRERATESEMTVSQQLYFLADTIIDYLQTHKKEAALLDKRFSVCFSAGKMAENDAFRGAAGYLETLLTDRGVPAQQAQQQLYLLGNMFFYSACDAVLSGTPYTAEQLKPTIRAMLTKLFDGGDTD